MTVTSYRMTERPPMPKSGFRRVASVTIPTLAEALQRLDADKGFPRSWLSPEAAASFADGPELLGLLA